MLDKNRRQEPVLRITGSFSFKSKCQAWHFDLNDKESVMLSIVEKR
jgi:hypothetical protein